MGRTQTSLKGFKTSTTCQHATLGDIYGKLPRISSKLMQRTVRFSGHCYRTKDEVISSLLLWTSPVPNRSNRLTYPDVISRVTGIKVQYIPAAMAAQPVWRSIVHSFLADDDDDDDFLISLNLDLLIWSATRGTAKSSLCDQQSFMVGTW